MSAQKSKSYNEKPLDMGAALRIQVKLDALDEQLSAAVLAGEREGLKKVWKDIKDYYRNGIDQQNMPTIRLLQKSYLDGVLKLLHVYLDGGKPSALPEMRKILLKRLEDRDAGRDPVTEGIADGKAMQVESGDPQETTDDNQDLPEKRGPGSRKGKGKEGADTPHASPVAKAARTPGARLLEEARRTDSGGSHLPPKTPAKTKAPAAAARTVIRPALPVARPTAPRVATPGPSGLNTGASQEAVKRAPAPKAPSQTTSGPKPPLPRVYVGKPLHHRTPALPRMIPSFAALDRDDSDDGKVSTPEEQPESVGDWFAYPCSACLGKFECLVRGGSGQRLACVKCHRLKGKCSHAGVDVPRATVNPQVLKKPGAGKQQEVPAAPTTGGKRKKEADSGEQGPRKKKRGTPPPDSEVEVLEGPKPPKKMRKDKGTKVVIAAVAAEEHAPEAAVAGLSRTSAPTDSMSWEEAFRSLRRRIRTLEEQPSVSERLDGIDDALRDMDSSHDAQLDLLVARMEVAEGQLAGHDTQFATDHKNYRVLKSSDERNRGYIENLQAGIRDLQTEVDAQKDLIRSLELVVKSHADLLEEWQFSGQFGGMEDDDEIPDADQVDCEESYVAFAEGVPDPEHIVEEQSDPEHYRDRLMFGEDSSPSSPDGLAVVQEAHDDIQVDIPRDGLQVVESMAVDSAEKVPQGLSIVTGSPKHTEEPPEETGPEQAIPPLVQLIPPTPDSPQQSIPPLALSIPEHEQDVGPPASVAAPPVHLVVRRSPRGRSRTPQASDTDQAAGAKHQVGEDAGPLSKRAKGSEM